jgi:hypothetical protein
VFASYIVTPAGCNQRTGDVNQRVEGVNQPLEGANQQPIKGARPFSSESKSVPNKYESIVSDH